MSIQARSSADLESTGQASPVRRPMPRVRRTGELVGPVGWIAAAVFLLRLPFVDAPVSPDEGGFLQVAAHWHAGGGSLYGPYWVDRPPLLIALFRLADLFGGLVALRVIGAIAVAVTVAAIGWTLTQVAGRRAGTWAAVMAAILLVSPSGGGMIINGELLASPFLAIGFACTVRAVRAPQGDSRAGLAAVLAGVAAVAAVLVKQNMIDVVVFAVVLGVGSALAHHLPWSLLLRRTLLAAAGAVSTLATILLLAWVAGTTPSGIYDAMYPFRLQVAKLMSHQSMQGRISNATHMVGYWLVTGAPLVIVAFVLLCLWWLVRRRRVAPPGPLVFTLAVVALAAYDVFSIGAGGSYWLHYVLQLAFPTAAMAGLLASRLPRLGRGVVCVALVGGLVSWAGACLGTAYVPGTVVGRAVEKVAQPQDTLVSLLGDPSIVYSSHLNSPYTYLWSLPARVRDPGYHRLQRLLAGASAPTWVAVRGPSTVSELKASVVGPTLSARYHLVAQICQRRIYLLDGVSRPSPKRSNGCYRPFLGFSHNYSHHLNMNIFGGSSS